MRTTTVVIGAGHAGLAMSHYLTSRSIDHVLLERGEVANSWKTQRWDSLRLLTPNWQSRLPGYWYDGPDPDGYRTMPQTVKFIERYAADIAAPVHTHTTVRSVRLSDEGYRVTTSDGVWRSRSVVLANGASTRPKVPAFAANVPSSIATLSPLAYRNPDQLDQGGVLIVGASASGIQLAEEIQRSGRSVTLAVGEHVRVPRVYRGQDIQWWMDVIGVHDELYTEVDSVERVRHVPSAQLIGSDDRASIDLNHLQHLGVRIVGRLAGIAEDGRAQFSGSLHNVVQMADLKMNRLLDRIDEWVSDHGHEHAFDLPERFVPTYVDASPVLGLDFAKENIKTIVWATGFRSDYSWLHVPVLDYKGRLRHDGGVVDAPGLYALGLSFMRRRKSTLIDGAADDARDLSAHLAAYLDGHHTTSAAALHAA